MSAIDPFAEYPELQTWREKLNVAEAGFEAELEIAKTIGGDHGFAHFINSYTRFYLAFGEANEAVGIPFSRKDVSAIFIDCFCFEGVGNDWGRGHLRAIATRIAYEDGWRPTSVGANDTPMQAATQVAAIREGLNGSDSGETIRKSITRLRSKVRGKNVFRFDENTLTVECLDAESILLGGLPGKRGRPRNKPKPDCR